MRNKSEIKQRVGFTLVEIMVAMSIGMIALAGIMKAFIFYLGSVNLAEVNIQADQGASFVVQRLVRGSPATSGLRQLNFNTTTLVSDSAGWTLSESATNGYQFVKSNKTISDLKGNIIADNVTESGVTFQPGNPAISISVEVEARNGRSSSSQVYETTISSRNN